MLNLKWTWCKISDQLYLSNDNILDMSKLKVFAENKITKYRNLGFGRVREKEKMLVTSSFSFSLNVFKILFPCCWKKSELSKESILYQTYMCFNNLEGFLKHCGEIDKMLLTGIFSFFLESFESLFLSGLLNSLEAVFINHSSFHSTIQL